MTISSNDVINFIMTISSKLTIWLVNFFYFILHQNFLKIAAKTSLEVPCKWKHHSAKLFSFTRNLQRNFWFLLRFWENFDVKWGEKIMSFLSQFFCVGDHSSSTSVTFSFKTNPNHLYTIWKRRLPEIF